MWAIRHLICADRHMAVPCRVEPEMIRKWAKCDWLPLKLGHWTVTSWRRQFLGPDLGQSSCSAVM